MAAVFLSCQYDKKNAENPGSPAQAPKEPAVISFRINEDSVLRSYESWYDYYYYNISLSQVFKALDADSVTIGKMAFLQKLGTGNFAPFKIAQINDTPVYKLGKLISPDKNIQSTIIQLSGYEISNTQREGQTLPHYTFKDINGNIYTNSSTKGKVIWLKCWFINCVACVKEFPELNRIVEANKSDPDVLFISLASDSKEQLQDFLTKRPFGFSVVPNQGNYMSDKLKLHMYPTHFLINREGVITKVTNSEKEMLPFFNEAIKN